jgi:hypothetical protein
MPRDPEGGGKKLMCKCGDYPNIVNFAGKSKWPHLMEVCRVAENRRRICKKTA